MKIRKISLEGFGWILGSGKRKNIELIWNMETVSFPWVKFEVQ